jgi:hypothetical protein
MCDFRNLQVMIILHILIRELRTMKCKDVTIIIEFAYAPSTGLRFCKAKNTMHRNELILRKRLEQERKRLEQIDY